MKPTMEKPKRERRQMDKNMRRKLKGVRRKGGGLTATAMRFL
jgi:hypothetical protein